MSESNPNSGELADLLWERQGRPVDRSPDNWLENEYHAHPPALLQRPFVDQREVELRMRGLGPLTKSEPDAVNSVEYKLHPLLHAVACGVAVAIGLVTLGALLGGTVRSLSIRNKTTVD